MVNYNAVSFHARSMTLATSTIAAPEYTTIAMEIDVAKPASEVWAKVGGYCDISKWLNLDCTRTFGKWRFPTRAVLGQDLGLVE
jgi:hypothetical protein